MSDTKNTQLSASVDALVLLPQTGFSRLPAVRRFAGNAAGSTIYLWISQGKFPRGVKLSPRVTVWRNEDLHRWAADPLAWHAEQVGA
ncbi:helix-turn-helix transcriptional regulator [Castellaniella defragrans]|uniref:helix-turn-helix transcriptional regulator n=1 Tax=Castellaniella defragrans TaxID=75697 RepID=UPI00130DCFA7|nr:AlpA family phage regulatory protein [Castellaniella defragrans]